MEPDATKSEKENEERKPEVEIKRKWKESGGGKKTKVERKRKWKENGGGKKTWPLPAEGGATGTSQRGNICTKLASFCIGCPPDKSEYGYVYETGVPTDRYSIAIVYPDRPL